MGTEDQDWTTGKGDTRVMLNTDVSFLLPIFFPSSSYFYVTSLTNIPYLSVSSSFSQICLLFDIKENMERSIHCCSKAYGCNGFEAARKRCPMYSQHDRMQRASDAVHDMLGGESIQNK